MSGVVVSELAMGLRVQLCGNDQRTARVGVGELCGEEEGAGVGEIVFFWGSALDAAGQQENAGMRESRSSRCCTAARLRANPRCTGCRVQWLEKRTGLLLAGREAAVATKAGRLSAVGSHFAEEDVRGERARGGLGKYIDGRLGAPQRLIHAFYGEGYRARIHRRRSKLELACARVGDAAGPMSQSESLT